ncbi:TolC family protein [candidate division KSB1 bacterium]|nr:TolC family protein [candidate division KSB1 bacterium]
MNDCSFFTYTLPNNRHQILYGKIPSFLASILIGGLVLGAPASFASENDAAATERNAPVTISDNTALTEAQVVQLMLPYRRKLQSLETSLEIEKYRYQSSGWIRNPELRISDISNRYPNNDYSELEIGLRIRIPDLGELSAEKQKARVDLWEKRVEAVRERQQLIARVRQNFADVILYDQLAELARQRVTKERERLNVIERMVEIGSRSIVYFTKAKMWNAESKNDYDRAVQKQSFARRTLARRSGIAEDTPLATSDLPEVTQDVDVLINLAYKNRPEIQLVDQRIELTNRQKRYEIMQLFPWPNYVEISHHEEMKKTDTDWRELKLGIQLPLFNWNSGNIKATSLAVKKKEDESVAIRESIEDEVRTAYDTYKDLLLDWKNFKVSADELITNANAVVEQAHHHQTLMPDEVYEMDITIIETKKLLSERRWNLAYALIELYYAMGIEGPEKLNELKAGNGQSND